MAKKAQSKMYTGTDRRARVDRRTGLERRNLVRYESIGSDRRIQDYRRKEESFNVGQGRP